MEILIILLLLMRDDKTKEKLSPVLAALLKNKEVLSAVLSSINENAPKEAAEEEKSAPEEDGSGEKSEAIEKFLNSYFK